MTWPLNSLNKMCLFPKPSIEQHTYVGIGDFVVLPFRILSASGGHFE